jgi:hypothetical protein
MKEASEMSIKTGSFNHGLNELIKEIEVNNKAAEDNPKFLHLESIRMAHSVFQPRQFLDDSMSSSGAHIHCLIEAIYNEPSHTLDPITVWWSGTTWRVIDGAHRLIAYRTVNKQGKLKNLMIPVQVFHGDLYQAIQESIRLNSKDKLPMTKSDKANSAWRLTVSEKFSKRMIHLICKVSTTTVSRMRNVLAHMKTKLKDKYLDVALGLSWEKAQRFGKDDITRDDLWEDHLAKEWARRLAREFGNKAATQINAFARAIEIYSSKLPDALAEQWGYKHDDSEPTQSNLSNKNNPDLEPEF